MRSAAAGNRVACAGEVTGTPRGELMQIGQVAERTGLSLRTIRFYEEIGLVLPTARFRDSHVLAGALLAMSAGLVLRST
ncbi:MerR family DNA-binding transcriptional regulator, partial [Enterococcus faecalis]|uniref:MerR family DNA-binding transcriptional regulator n=1 Tax=Enterococcus faecalis TaxID=1351 RepID=UPI003D6B5413